MPKANRTSLGARSELLFPPAPRDAGNGCNYDAGCDQGVFTNHVGRHSDVIACNQCQQQSCRRCSHQAEKYVHPSLHGITPCQVLPAIPKDNLPFGKLRNSSTISTRLAGFANRESILLIRDANLQHVGRHRHNGDVRRKTHMRPRPFRQARAGVWRARCSSCRVPDAATQVSTGAQRPILSGDFTWTMNSEVAWCAARR
jgi:hypothetical protein